MKSKWSWLSAIVICSILALPLLSHATPVIQISDGDNTLVADPIGGVINIEKTWLGSNQSNWLIDSLYVELNPSGFTIASVVSVVFSFNRSPHLVHVCRAYPAGKETRNVAGQMPATCVFSIVRATLDVLTSAGGRGWRCTP